MTERINTTVTAGESAAWLPAGETLVQVSGPAASKAVVELHGRADAAAPYAYIASARVASEAFMFCMRITSVKLVWHGNTAGSQLTVWSAE